MASASATRARTASSVSAGTSGSEANTAHHGRVGAARLCSTALVMKALSETPRSDALALARRNNGSGRSTVVFTAKPSRFSAFPSMKEYSRCSARQACPGKGGTLSGGCLGIRSGYQVEKPILDPQGFSVSLRSIRRPDISRRDAYKKILSDNMKPDGLPLPPRNGDDRGYRSIDRVAYIGLGGYSIINIIWIAWAFSGAGSGIFHTAILIGLTLPILGVISLIGFQASSRHNRFSALANVLSVFVIGGWFLCVWHIVGAASAAV